jgi:hypothetical protein
MREKSTGKPVGARFFCEECGTEVGSGAVRCPGCGKTFAAVRCPACGFAGAESDFAAGCPACGKGAPGAAPAGAAQPGTGSHARSSAKGALRASGKAAASRTAAGRGLPRWFYPVVTAGLAVIAIALLAALLLS